MSNNRPEGMEAVEPDDGNGVYSNNTNTGTNNPAWNEMTEEEQKKRASGLCCFNLLGLVSTAGFICGVYSFAHCDFLSRFVVLTADYENEYSKACQALGYGSDAADSMSEMNDAMTSSTVSSSSQFTSNTMNTICSSLLQNHGIGFSYWQATIPVDQTVCFTYTQLTPWGYVSPVFDSAFIASRWFSCIGYVFGGAAWFTLTCSSCCRIDQTRLKGIACYFWIATFFQGMSLIMFKSKVCQPGFFQSYFMPPSQQQNATLLAEVSAVIEDVQCTLSLGSKMAISATVLYFLCSIMVPFAIVPFYEPRAYSQDDPEMQQQQQQQQGQTIHYSDDGQQQAPGGAAVVQGTAVPSTTGQ
mmetsp:Transcript_34117/g.38176  ORF Transcript_34117/g.38176 Transcript_34117/m.38176 type:complete len:356 (+) Transcript_34117:45-1112(+)